WRRPLANGQHSRKSRPGACRGAPLHGILKRQRPKNPPSPLCRPNARPPWFRNRPMTRIAVAVAGIVPLACGLALAQPATPKQQPSADKPSAQAVEFFESKIRPILVERCLKCHGSEKQKADLRLDS